MVSERMDASAERVETIEIIASEYPLCAECGCRWLNEITYTTGRIEWQCWTCGEQSSNTALINWARKPREGEQHSDGTHHTSTGEREAEGATE